MNTLKNKINKQLQLKWKNGTKEKINKQYQIKKLNFKTNEKIIKDNEINKPINKFNNENDFDKNFDKDYDFQSNQLRTIENNVLNAFDRLEKVFSDGLDKIQTDLDK